MTKCCVIFGAAIATAFQRSSYLARSDLDAGKHLEDAKMDASIYDQVSKKTAGDETVELKKAALEDENESNKMESKASRGVAGKMESQDFSGQNSSQKAEKYKLASEMFKTWKENGCFQSELPLCKPEVEEAESFYQTCHALNANKHADKHDIIIDSDQDSVSDKQHSDNNVKKDSKKKTITSSSSASYNPPSSSFLEIESEQSDFLPVNFAGAAADVLLLGNYTTTSTDDALKKGKKTYYSTPSSKLGEVYDQYNHARVTYLQKMNALSRLWDKEKCTTTFATSDTATTNAAATSKSGNCDPILHNLVREMESWRNSDLPSIMFFCGFNPSSSKDIRILSSFMQIPVSEKSHSRTTPSSLLSSKTVSKISQSGARSGQSLQGSDEEVDWNQPGYWTRSSPQVSTISIEGTSNWHHDHFYHALVKLSGLYNDLATTKASEASRQTLESTLSSITNQLATKEKRMDAKKKFKQIDNKTSQLSGRLDQLATKDMYTATKREFNAAEAALTSRVNTKLQSLTNEYSAVKRDAEETKKKLGKTESSLQDQKEKLADYVDAVATTTARRNKLDIDVQDAVQKVEDIENTVNDNARTLVNWSGVDATKNEANSLSVAQTNLRDKIDALKTTNSDIKQRMTELAGADTALRKEDENLGKSIDQERRAQIENKKELKEEVNKLENTNREVRNLVDSATSKNRVNEGNLKMLKDNLDTTAAQVERDANGLNDARDSINTQETAIGKLETKVEGNHSELEGDLDTRETNLNKAMEVNDEGLEKDIETLETNSEDDLDNTFTALEATHDSTQTQLENEIQQETQNAQTALSDIHGQILETIKDAKKATASQFEDGKQEVKDLMVENHDENESKLEEINEASKNRKAELISTIAANKKTLENNDVKLREGIASEKGKLKELADKNTNLLGLTKTNKELINRVKGNVETVDGKIINLDQSTTKSIDHLNTHLDDLIKTKQKENAKAIENLNQRREQVKQQQQKIQERQDRLNQMAIALNDYIKANGDQNSEEHKKLLASVQAMQGDLKTQTRSTDKLSLRLSEEHKRLKQVESDIAVQKSVNDQSQANLKAEKTAREASQKGLEDARNAMYEEELASEQSFENLMRSVTEKADKDEMEAKSALAKTSASQKAAYDDLQEASRQRANTAQGYKKEVDRKVNEEQRKTETEQAGITKKLDEREAENQQETSELENDLSSQGITLKQMHKAMEDMQSKYEAESAKFNKIITALQTNLIKLGGLVDANSAQNKHTFDDLSVQEKANESQVANWANDGTKNLNLAGDALDARTQKSTEQTREQTVSLRDTIARSQGELKKEQEDGQAKTELELAREKKNRADEVARLQMEFSRASEQAAKAETKAEGVDAEFEELRKRLNAVDSDGKARFATFADQMQGLAQTVDGEVKQDMATATKDFAREQKRTTEEMNERVNAMQNTLNRDLKTVQATNQRETEDVEQRTAEAQAAAAAAQAAANAEATKAEDTATTVKQSVANLDGAQMQIMQAAKDVARELKSTEIVQQRDQQEIQRLIQQAIQEGNVKAHTVEQDVKNIVADYYRSTSSEINKQKEEQEAGSTKKFKNAMDNINASRAELKQNEDDLNAEKAKTVRDEADNKRKLKEVRDKIENAEGETKAKLQQTEQELLDTAAEIEKTKKEQDRQERMIAEDHAELNKQENEIHSMHQAVWKQQGDIKAESAALRYAQDRLGKTKEELDFLTGEEKRQEQQITKTQAKIGITQNFIQEEEGKLRGLKLEQEQLNKNMAAANAEAKKLQGEIDAHAESDSAKLNGLRTALASQKADISEYTEQQSKFADDEKSLNQRLGIAHKQLEKHKKEHQEDQDKLNNIRLNIGCTQKKLQQDGAEMNKINANVGAIREQIDDDEKKLGTLLEEVNQEGKDVGAIRQDLTEFTKMASERMGALEDRLSLKEEGERSVMKQLRDQILELRSQVGAADYEVKTGPPKMHIEMGRMLLSGQGDSFIELHNKNLRSAAAAGSAAGTTAPMSLMELHRVVSSVHGKVLGNTGAAANSTATGKNAAAVEVKASGELVVKDSILATGTALLRTEETKVKEEISKIVSPLYHANTLHFILTSVSVITFTIAFVAVFQKVTKGQTNEESVEEEDAAVVTA